MNRPNRPTYSEHPVYRAEQRNADGWQQEIERLAAADRRCHAAKLRLASLKRQGRVFYGD